MDPKLPLTDQMLRFVNEYIQDPSNATKAAIRAGYSIDTAKVAASKLMRDPRVKRAIEDSQKEGLKICGITQARILQELALIAFAKPGDVLKKVGEDGSVSDDIQGEVNVSTIDSAGRKSRAVSVKTIKMADKLTALDKLGKHLGMFKEQVDVNHSMSLRDMILQAGQEDTSEISEPETIN